MTTPLQRAFEKSAIRRMLAYYVMKENRIRIKGYKRLFNYAVGKAFSGPEAQIKQSLLLLLTCYDLPPDLRKEACKLLAMAETALTTEQRKLLDKSL